MAIPVPFSVMAVFAVVVLFLVVRWIVGRFDA